MTRMLCYVAAQFALAVICRWGEVSTTATVTFIVAISITGVLDVIHASRSE